MLADAAFFSLARSCGGPWGPGRRRACRRPCPWRTGRARTCAASRRRARTGCEREGGALSALRTHPAGEALGGAPAVAFPVMLAGLVGVLVGHAHCSPCQGWGPDDGRPAGAGPAGRPYGKRHSALLLAIAEQSRCDPAPVLDPGVPEADPGADDDLVPRGPHLPDRLQGHDRPRRLGLALGLGRPVRRGRMSPSAMD